MIDMAEKSTKDELLEVIDGYLEDSGEAKSKFSINVANDPSFYDRLCGGADLTTKTLDRAYDYMKRWYQENG